MKASPKGEPGDVTRLLHRVRAGDEEAVHRLMPLNYEELKSAPRRQLRRELGYHSIEVTSPAHEAYMKLAGRARVDWQSRAHFLAWPLGRCAKSSSTRLVR